MPAATIDTPHPPAGNGSPIANAPTCGAGPRDIVGLGIAWAAIVLLVGTGGAVMPGVVAMFAGVGIGPDELLANALILNIALVILGWRRQAELKAEVRDRRAAEAAARRLADIDPLTGCLNRRALAQAAAPFLAAARARGDTAAVVVLDLDNFKPINDAHGHAAGDAILGTIARRVAAAMPPGSLLARLGGDEFACAFAFAPARDGDADRVVARLIAAVTTPIPAAGITALVTASLGIARADAAAASTSEELLHRADLAMYRAKAAGRNRAMWYDPAMDDDHRQRQRTEAAIRLGLARGEFVPRFVRRIDAATGALVGFEMQPHWQAPAGDAPAAAAFVPIAEDMGVIGALVEALLTQALAEMRGWDPALTLSVPVSPAILRDPWFAQRFLRRLVEAGIAPARIDIAIGEACLGDDPAGTIASLRNQGIGICLDGLATGWGLAGGHDAPPVDRIAIDRRFVAAPEGAEGARPGRRRAAMAQAIAAFGRGLGVPLTAAGVASDDLRACLRAGETADPAAPEGETGGRETGAGETGGGRADGPGTGPHDRRAGAPAGPDDGLPRAAADVRAELARLGMLIVPGAPATSAPMPAAAVAATPAAVPPPRAIAS